MPCLSVNGRTIYYEFDDFTPPWETRPVVLIQHGMGRNTLFWRQWPPALATAWRVIRIDLPGHGGSEDPGPDYLWTMDALVADLAAFLDALEVSKVHFLGESTGGMLGVAFATSHPERVGSLTLCASPTTIGPAAQKLFAMGHADWQTAIRTLGSRGWAEALSGIGGTMGEISEAQRDWTLAQFDRIPSRALEDYSRLISTTDVAPLLGRIAAPTLILAPTRSAATPMSQQYAMRDAIPGAQLVEIDGVAHEIFRDRADDCLAAFKAFLRSVESA